MRTVDKTDRICEELLFVSRLGALSGARCALSTSASCAVQKGDTTETRSQQLLLQVCSVRNERTGLLLHFDNSRQGPRQETGKRSPLQCSWVSVRCTSTRAFDSLRVKIRMIVRVDKLAHNRRPNH